MLNWFAAEVEGDPCCRLLLKATNGPHYGCEIALDIFSSNGFKSSDRMLMTSLLGDAAEASATTWSDTLH